MGSKHKLWTGDFVLILGIALLSYIVCQSLNNGIPIYVTKLGSTTAYAGWLILEFSIAAAAARIVTGRIIDAGTRKSALVFGGAVMTIGSLAALAVPGVEAQAVFRVLQGIGFGSITTAASTAADDVLPAQRLGEGIGYYGLGQSLGMAIGPTLAVVLTSMVFSESLFVGASAVAACALLLAFTCTYEKHPERLPQTCAAQKRAQAGHKRSDSAKAGPNESLLSTLFVKSALPGAIPMVISCLGYSVIVSFASLYGTQIGIPNPGTFFIFSAVTMTAVRLGGGVVLDRARPRVLLALPIACGVVSLLMLANPVNPWVFYVAGAFFGMSMGLCFPLLNSVCVKLTVPERWGAANALFFLMNDMGIGIGSLAWGAVADHVGFVPVMYGGIIMLVAAYVAALVFFPKNM